MPSKIIARALAVAALACTAPVIAQQPNPLDAIPEKVPFNVPYGAPITLDKADAVLAAAVAEAKAKGWPLVCAVVDSGADLVSFKRMDGAQLGSIEISQAKANAAVKLRRETKVLEGAIQGGFAYLATLPGVVASRGGIPLVEGGRIIGAIGCSGGTGSQDEVVCKAGADAVK